MPGAEGRDRRRLLLSLGAAAGVAACRPLVQPPAGLGEGDGGPRLEREVLVASDGAELPLRIWPALDPAGAPADPWAVIVALHGMNDYAAAFTLPGPFWAAQGVTTYAYDQRGFGSAPGRGVWGGETLMQEDLRTTCTLLRARHPSAILLVVGESMGGAVAITAFASDRPPTADRLVLTSPAVWGWKEQGPFNSALLWAGAHVAPGSKVTAPNWLARRIWASDNVEELRRMGLDRRMIFATRIDMIYGLVNLMQDAADEIGGLRVPTLYQYGAHDEIIPKHASFAAARRLPQGDQTAYYRDGWHLLLRDLHRQIVLQDVLSFAHDPLAPLPSDAQPIGPARVRRA